MIHKSLLFSGIALALLPSAAKAQMQVNPGTPFVINSGTVVAVFNGDVNLYDDVLGSGQLMLIGSTPQNLGGIAGKSVFPQLVINNSANVSLTSILRLSGDLNFTSGKLLAGSNNLVFTSTGTASGYGESQNRYVVTNGTGFCTKEGLAQNASFIFPIGRSITTGDYNQAVVTNTVAATRNFNVQVKNFSESLPTEANTTRGVDRTWQIYSNTSGAATIMLQHKASEEGSKYKRDSAYVSQRQASGRFDSVTTTAPPTAPNYTNTRTALVVPATAGDNTSYFSKSSDPINSLNAFVGVSPIVYLQAANTGAPLMATTLNNLGVLPLTQPYNTPFYNNYNGGESVPAGFFASHTNIVDWVLVEIRTTTTPNTIITKRAAFLLNNGQVVDLDGKTAVSFRSPTPLSGGTYHVAVRHRNHLGIRTTSPITLVQDDNVNYDFTNAANKSNGPAGYATINIGGHWSMYAGDASQDGFVRDVASPSDADVVSATVLTAPGNTTFDASYTGLNNTYNVADVNMDGSVRDVAAPSDADYIRVNVLTYPGNTTFDAAYTQMKDYLQ